MLGGERGKEDMDTRYAIFVTHIYPHVKASVLVSLSFLRPCRRVGEETLWVEVH